MTEEALQRTQGLRTVCSGLCWVECACLCCYAFQRPLIRALRSALGESNIAVQSGVWHWCRLRLGPRTSAVAQGLYCWRPQGIYWRGRSQRPMLQRGCQWNAEPNRCKILQANRFKAFGRLRGHGCTPVHDSATLGIQRARGTMLEAT